MKREDLSDDDLFDRADRPPLDPIAARVQRGAALLDGIEPGWRARIDLDQLDMAHQNRCVLGQIFGRYAFAPVDHRQNVACGFKATSADEVGPLGAEWRRVLGDPERAREVLDERTAR